MLMTSKHLASSDDGERERAVQRLRNAIAERTRSHRAAGHQAGDARSPLAPEVTAQNGRGLDEARSR